MERIPDLVPAPTAILCWKQDPRTLHRCDRRRDHDGLHIWQATTIIEGLKRAILDAIDKAQA